MSRAKEQKKYQQAAALFQQEKYARALALLEHLHPLLPQEDRRVVFARARCLAELGRTDEALCLCKELNARFKDPRGQKLADRLQSNKNGLSLDSRLHGGVTPPARGKDGRAGELVPPESALTRRLRWALLLSISAIVGVLAVTLFMIFNNTEILARVDTVNAVDRSVGSDKSDESTPLGRNQAAAVSEVASAAAGAEANAAGEQPAAPVVRGGLNKVGRLHLRGIDPDVAWTEEHSRYSLLDEMPDSFAGLRISARAIEQKPLAISRELDAFDRAPDPLELKYGFVPHARPMEEEFLRGGKDEKERMRNEGGDRSSLTLE